MNTSATTIGLLLGLIALLLVLVFFRRKKRPDASISGEQVKKNIEQWGASSCAGCMGACCEAPLQTPCATPPSKVDYFEDEELDRYAARAADSFSPEEIAEFREVLTTLLPQEISAWKNSLQKRNIPLPISLEPLLQQRLEEERNTI